MTSNMYKKYYKKFCIAFIQLLDLLGEYDYSSSEITDTSSVSPNFIVLTATKDDMRIHIRPCEKDRIIQVSVFIGSQIKFLHSYLPNKDHVELRDIAMGDLAKFI
jgi:hypothetical protein